MIEHSRLGYLVVGAARPQKWAGFCTTMLGLPAPVPNADGSQGWRIDGAAQRLVVQADKRDDLLALGIDCIDEAGLARRVARLREHGVAVTAAAPDAAAARRVRQMYVAADPAGNAVELFHGAEAAPGEFESAAFPGGFVAADLGFGHVALVARDLAAMESFWVDAMGFGVTERLHTKIGPLDVRGTFLHCNERHHSLALFALPSRKRIHHFMLEAREHMDVGRAFERTREAKVPLSLDIGQHPDPDGTFSFYAQTPSGFDFEIGTGGKLIDPRGWRAVNTGQTSSWGHRPQLRLKLRTAADLVAGKLWR
jgi:2,3-dihydroxybiphenyl 1,2-dioxygenase